MNNILIVEDGLIIAFHMQKLLEINGYNIVDKLKCAEDVQGVMESNKVDLILMDVMLEGDMNGIECTKLLRAYSSIPVVFMSALTDVDTLSQIADIANSFNINKPFEDDQLISTVKKALTTS